MFMGTPENYKLLEIVGSLKSWIPKRGEHANMPRDFWMPDQSCRVCYECDSPFTVFNRRHHCRLCGRVFCAKCASNSIPVPSEVANIGREDGERIRVCNYCFKQQKQGIAVVDNAISMTSPGISPSPSTTSLVSSQSSCTCNSGSSVDSTVYSTGPYLHVPCGSCQSPSLSAQTGPVSVKQDQLLSSENPYSEKYSSSNRNNDEDYDYSAYRVHSNPSHFCTADDYYGDVNCNEETLVCEPNNIHHSQENVGMDCGSSKMLPESIERKHLGSTEKVDEMVDANNNSMEYEDPSIDSVNSTASEPVDFENNGLLWLPPEPEDEEDEREALLDDDDNAGEGGSVGEWGYLSPSYSFADGEYRNREKSTEEHRRVVKNIVDGHFKALIGQLLKDENLSIGDEDDKETWLEIITALSWEAATFLKPDMSQSEGMDPGAYVKVKCIPCGHFTESVVIKGVVCKKNVAHRRMTSKIDKPRLLILGGALEYQRVTNHLSSFDTLLQQEKDHLMMAVAKIDAHHPNILVVEKSVSRHAQEYLLAKDISLVLNVKRPLLQRIARCTGAKIVPSIDNLTTQKLGYCDSFRVEKFVEEHGKAGHDGKKLMKTLMFFEGCPKPLGCTILLKGANVDELKKVKHVVQYGVFAAYHLALETSFLADEGASLPDLPLKSPIKVALPDKPPSFNRSITLIPGFTLPCPVDKSPQGSRTTSMSSQAIAVSSSNIASDCDLESYLSKGSCSKPNAGSRLDNLKLADSTTSLSYPRFDFQDQGYEGKNKDVNKNVPETSSVRNTEVVGREDLTSNCPSNLEALGQLGGFPHFAGTLQPAKTCTSELVPPEIDNHIEELEPLKEDFSHSPSDHQSILVSLSTRCVWKGTVCERSRLFRIKYYGSFDLPLGRFLRDHLFDQNYRCHSCEMPSEAHVHCYTHQQGSLTISVKKLPTVVLPGEREGKIWMWHRCMQCPRANGFPPATRRVVMSDAARALSFGKFLELSFSNHAAASRVAGCGHSLHRDCLRFYGFGKMVACFRYAPINVHSVFLPPQKLEFNYDNQEWIHREVNEVCSRADSLFVEVFKALHKISEQNFVKDGAKAQDSGHRIAKLERILEKEKMEFEELLGKVLNGEVKADEPSVDVLEVNRLKRQLVLLAYLWDQRLVHITTSDKKDSQSLSSSAPKVKEKPFSSTDTPAERNEISCPGKGFNNNDSFLQSAKSDIAFTEGGCGQPLEGHKRMHMDQNQSHRKEHEVCHSSSTNISDQSNQEPGKNVKQVHSEGQFPVMENLSDTLDAAWTGEGHSASKDSSSSSPMDSSSSIKTQAVSGVLQSDDVDYQTWLMTPFLSFYQSFHKNVRNSQKHGNLSEYSPVYILSFRELLHQGGARVLLPVGVNDTVVPVYDDEPTSVISYALVSTDYHIQMSDAPEKTNKVESSVSLPFLDSFSLLSLTSFDEVISESLRGIGSIDESTLSSLGSRSSSLDQHLYTNVLQARITFSDDGPQGKVKYTVTCYYAKQFEALRKACCSSELDFIRSLSRCKKWGAQGGKSNVFFAKTLDDRFIIKQVTKTELESFIKFAPAYFKYLSDAIASKSPTCLAKILGIYQVASKHLKGGKESKMDVLVMENLLFRRNITRLYDLKGSSRSRYNPDSSGSNKVLLDQNLIESMPTSPIFLGPKAKRLLERAVWNDTAFLASIDVMDYSLLAGVDEEKHELVLGIIDFMRQYTWDKHLETWVKASGILGGPKNASPTVISPEQYKKRFRKAMSAYFLMVPDRWSSSAVVVSIPSHQSNLNEGNSQGGASLE